MSGGRNAQALATDNTDAGTESQPPNKSITIRTLGTSSNRRVGAYVRKRIGDKLLKFGGKIQKLTVSFEDVNGPKGGEDTVCRVMVTLNGLETVVYKTQATDALQAVDKAANGVERAVRRTLDRAQIIRHADLGHTATRITHAPKPPGHKSRATKATPKKARPTAEEAAYEPNAPPQQGSLIGRRVGRSIARVRNADAPAADTSREGVSATDRKAGGGSTARRNVKNVHPGATAMLEDSATGRPSRKSTRKSANRSKQASNSQRRQTRQVTSPSSRASRGK